MAQVVNLTFTSPVNKPGQQPVLSANDVWKGLEYITRRPEDIVDYLAGCEILSDNGLNLKRRLLFKEGTDMPDKPIEQDVTLCPKMKVCSYSLSPSILRKIRIVTNSPGRVCRIYGHEHLDGDKRRRRRRSVSVSGLTGSIPSRGVTRDNRSCGV